MVNLTIAEVRGLMNKKRNIRNVTIIINDDHVKSTLTDSLLSKAGINVVVKADEHRSGDTQRDICPRCKATKPTAISILFELNEKDLDFVRGDNPVESEDVADELKKRGGFLIHLVDTPCNAEFTFDVAAALRVVDGAVFVVHCVYGACIQTEAVLRKAIAERVKPLLVLNHLDHALFELHLSHEELFRMFKRVVDNFNVIIATYGEDAGPMSNFTVDPSEGNVAFGALIDDWAFTLKQFAEIYAAKFGIKVDKLMKNLWGDRFFNVGTKKWSSDATPDSKRGFCQFALHPIVKLYDATLNAKKDEVAKLIEKLGLNLTDREQSLDGMPLLKTLLRKWLPSGDALLEMICIHLPSPVTAQQYRMELLYEGPHGEEAAVAIRNCAPGGALMMYVSKMLPRYGASHYYAFGRVFSGKVASGMKVRVQGPTSYKNEGKVELCEKKHLHRTVLMMGRYAERIDDVPSGNIVGLLMTKDEHAARSGSTITTFKDAHNMRAIKIAMSRVMRVAVEPVIAEGLPRLIEGLKRLAEMDPMIQCSIEDSGQHFINGVGERHLERYFEDLEEYDGIGIKKSEPLVSYRETVSANSREVCTSKSPNKHNSLCMSAQPMADGLVDAIEKGEFSVLDDSEQRAKVLADKHDYDLTEARKIWCFGPEGTGANVLVDLTKGVQFLDEIKESARAGFQFATNCGVLCEEPVRGVRFNIHDGSLHIRAIERRLGQIFCTTRRAMYASILTAQPRLLEPVYLVEIQCPVSSLAGIYELLHRRCGEIFEDAQVAGTQMYVVKAHLPVKQSFDLYVLINILAGFTEDLSSSTGGEIFSQYIFDRWQLIPGDPLDGTSISYHVMAEMRKRKGLKEGVPDLNNYLDKLQI